MTVSVSISKGNDDTPPATTRQSNSGMSSSASASSYMFFNRNGGGRGGSKSKNSNNNTGTSSAVAASSSSRSKGVWLGRCLFLGCLAVVAIVLCYLANHIATGSEKELSERQFDSISEKALLLSQNIADRKLRAAETMASIFSFSHPNSNDWPYVIVDGYETISQELIVMSSGRGMAFAPFVQPSIVDEFSDWAYDYMETTYPESRETLGTFSFGKGIAAQDPSLGTEDGKYPADKDGSVRGFDSPNKFFAPVLQHNKGPDGPLMQSMRHDPKRGTFMDQMIDCSKEKAAKMPINYNNTNATSMSNHHHCGGLTDMIFGQNEPGGMIVKPIYPANDADTLVGVIVSSILWRTTIEGVFSNEVRGIDCVLESDSHIYTYEIINGIATLKGRGDLHDTNYDQYAKSTKLGGDCKTNANFSANYTLTLYPNKELFDVYSTNNPTIAIVGVVITSMVISVVFFLYDYCVRQDINEKRAVMEAKRLFVRYVSHEVRTPLNAACMGTRLIQDEIKRVLTTAIDNDEQEQQEQQSSPKDSMMQLPATTNEEDGDEKEEEQQQQQQRQSPLGSFATYIQGLLQEVSDNVESAVDILNDLLHYDKIKTGRMKLELSKIPIFDIIEKTVTEFKLSAASKNIHVELDFHSLLNNENSSSTGEEECDDHDDEEKAMMTKSIHAHELPDSVQQYRVIGDTIRITQALRNLLSNAMKFTPETGVITVAVSLTLYHYDVTHEKTFELNNGETLSATKAGNLRIQVTDTGAGMTQDQLGQLFHDGVQFNVNQLQAGQGSGLGLCITKGIVEQHCGSLSAASDGLNKGATFTAELPMYKMTDRNEDKKEVNPSERTATTMTTMEHCSDSVDVRPLSSISDSSCLPPNKQLPPVEPENLHILVVDDSLTNRKLLVRLLKNRGHSCEEAKDGVEAVEQVKQCIKEGRFFDTIPLDYEMPGKDGPTASKEMRELGCDSFIVGITGNVLPEDVAYFKQKGANAVLPKPIHMETLESAWMEFGIFGRDPGKGEAA